MSFYLLVPSVNVCVCVFVTDSYHDDSQLIQLLGT